MVGYNKRPSDRPSIKYRSIPVEGLSFELADFVHEEYVPTPSDSKKKQCNIASKQKSVEILSTAQLISAVGQIWDYASHPLPFLQTKKRLNYNDRDSEKEERLANLGVEGNGRVPTSADSNCLCVKISTTGHNSPMVQPNLDCQKATQKMLILGATCENHAPLLFQSFLQGHNMSNELWRKTGVSGEKISYGLGNVYIWMGEIRPTGLKHRVKVTEIENKKAGESYITGDTPSLAGCCIAGDKCCSASLANCDSNLMKCSDTSLINTVNLSRNATETTSLCKDYFLAPIPGHGKDIGASRSPSSSIYADYYINSLASCNSASEECQHKTDGNELPENNTKEPKKSVIEDEREVGLHLSGPEKPHYTFAKQGHAFAGALAGIFVSLCLHPVDTVKTVIQSCRAEQKSICYIGKSIVSDRGKLFYVTLK